MPLHAPPEAASRTAPRLSEAGKTAPDDRPARDILISLIVSTRDRGKFLPPFLASLGRLATRHPWEIILVDNGSTDATWSILSEYAESSDLPIRLLREPRPGLSYARNTGVRAASGSILCFTDDDCYPRPDFIDSVADVFQHNDVGFMGGRILLHDPEDDPVSITTRTSRALFAPRSFITTGEIQGACMAFRREVLADTGLFDTAFGAGAPLKGAEDCDLVARACFAGWNGGFFTEPVVYHHHRRRAEATAASTSGYDYARGAYFAKLLLKHPEYRRLIMRHWYWDTKMLQHPSRRNFAKFWREFQGACRYIFSYSRRTQPRLA